jgi:hypothetical protein
MTNPVTEQMFRHAAEAEGGMTVSAGARIAHVRLALESGRAVTVDLSQVPEDLRSSVVAVIREIVNLAAGRSTKPDVDPIPGSSTAARPS